MYCRNCGKELKGNESFCSQCGAQVDKGAATPVAAVAPKPAAPQTSSDISSKSRLAVTLLAVLPGYFGIAGVHRFYLGKIGTGIAMLLTFGGLGIWTLIDFIMAVSGTMKDKEGKYIKNW